MFTSSPQHRIPDQNVQRPHPIWRELPREVLVPPRWVYLWRGAVLLLLSWLAMLVADTFLALVGVGYSMYCFAVWSRVRVVLSQDGLNYRGAGAEKTLTWDLVRTVQTIQAPIPWNPDWGSLTRRVQVAVELTTGETIVLPGFDSRQAEPMEQAAERINHWRDCWTGAPETDR